MSMNRDKMPDASSLTRARSVHEKYNQAAFNGSDHAGAVEVVARELGETKEVVAKMLGAWSDFAKNSSATSSRLQNVEQMLAKAESQGGFSGGHFESGFGCESVGAQAARILQDEPGFQAASQATGQNMRAGNFSSRATVDLPIRAAITNVGVGQVGDTSIDGLRDRRSDYVEIPQPKLRLLDVLPSRRASANEVEYIRISSTGDAGEQLKEGDPKAEVEVGAELVTAGIATVAAHTTASKQVLSDAAALQGAIDRLIRYKVLAKLESLLINGTPASSKIDGLLNQAATLVPTIAGAGAMGDIVGEALVWQSNAGYAPNLVLMNPSDWFRLQITRTTTNEYVFGSPTSPVPPSLWNTRIVVTPAIPLDTGMVIDTAFTTLLDRWQTSVMVSSEHADNFTKNLVTILGEVRAGLEVADTGAILKFDFGNYV